MAFATVEAIIAIRKTDHLKWVPVTVLPEVSYSHLGRSIHMYTHLLIPSHSAKAIKQSRIAREILDHQCYRINLRQIEQWLLEKEREGFRSDLKDLGPIGLASRPSGKWIRMLLFQTKLIYCSRSGFSLGTIHVNVSLNNGRDMAAVEIVLLGLRERCIREIDPGQLPQQIQVVRYCRWQCGTGCWIQNRLLSRRLGCGDSRSTT